MSSSWFASAPLVLALAVSAGCEGGVDETPDAGFFLVDAGGPRPDAGVIGEMTIQVQAVFDGDTVRVAAGQRVQTPDGKPMAGERIRFLGVNAPEIEHPPTPAECYGPDAAGDARQLLQGRTITLTYDNPARCVLPVTPAQAEGCNLRDEFGRLLAYMTLGDGTVANEALLRDGSACSFRAFRHRDTDKYNAIETEAKNAGRGLWRNCKCSSSGGAVVAR